MRYIFNAPDHHIFRVQHEGDKDSTEYKGGSEVEMSEAQHAGSGEPRLIPLDMAEAYGGFPQPVDQGEPDPDMIRARAIENQPIGTEGQYPDEHEGQNRADDERKGKR